MQNNPKFNKISKIQLSQELAKNTPREKPTNLD